MKIQVLCVHGGLSPDVRTIDQVSWTSFLNFLLASFSQDDTYGTLLQCHSTPFVFFCATNVQCRNILHLVYRIISGLIHIEILHLVSTTILSPDSS
jgi:hypothetical protein